METSRVNIMHCLCMGIVVGLILSWPSVSQAQSSRFTGQLGSMVYTNNGGGVTFRVWAPNATAVGVKGQFNGWATTPMVSEGGGIWSVDVNGAMPGQEYKYRINNSFDRRDPRARRVTNSNGNSIIYDPSAFDWGGVQKPQPWHNDLVIYQMHLGTFGGHYPPSTFDQAIPRLDHVKNLGISAIKLMPVNEFAGGRSWGYNPSDLFAIESDYGGPAAMKRFMRAAHERGIAVFMDVVHNHYGPSDLDMWRFDGWYQNDLGGIYFYNDGRAHTPWGSTRPDFGRQEVRDFIRDQIFMWVEEFRIGGFRWDSVYNMINTDWGFNDTGRAMLDTINTELANEYPYVVRGAEDHAFDGLMNFQNQWDVGYRWGLHGQVVTGSDSARDMWTVKGLLDGWASHSRVVFSEAHDYIARNHDRSRIPSEIDGGDNESIWARKRSLLAAGIVMTTPGIPMIFQGQEMLETYAFHDDTPLRWNRTNTFAGIVQAYTDLIHARRNLRGGMQGLKGTGINVHHVDNDNNVIAFIRWDTGGQTDDVMVVANFDNTRWTNNNYSIEFPSAGTWYSHFNSDSAVYQSDFDDIGPAQVTASGSPPTANVNMGRYSIQIFSKEPPSGTGIVTTQPESPDGCNPATILFDPADGPLEGAASVTLYWGRNGWQDIDETVMTLLGGDVWSTTVEVAEGTAELNLAFHDGAPEDPIWDDNEGRNWVVPISNCAGLPGIASSEPEFPSGCVPITITYRQRDGELFDAEDIYLYIGRNDWQNIQTLLMTNTMNDEWETTFQIAQGTWQLDFVFHDGNPDPDERIWDNNDWNDWQVFVTDCVAADFMGIVITNPASDVWVPYTQTTFTVLGRSARMVGDLEWENQATGEEGAFAAVTNWSVPTVPLSVGANLFRITGTNNTENPNAGARDSATNTTYDSGWSNSSNGGQGWGGGWELSASENAGHYISMNYSNQATLPRAWAMWANSDGLAEAVRPFADYLHPGDVFSFTFENNWIEDDRVVGFGLQNRFDQNLLEFIFIGGGDYYLINDSESARSTGINWTDGGLNISVELLTPTTYRLTADAAEITGTFATTSEALIRQVRIFNSSAGAGSGYNLYFSNLAIDGDPLESVEHRASRTVNRRYGPYFQALETESDDEIRIRFPVSEPGYYYDVHWSTNLLEGDPVWNELQLNLQGSGPPLNVYFTNTVPALFLRTSVRPIN